jgi:hypothetical protein
MYLHIQHSIRTNYFGHVNKMTKLSKKELSQLKQVGGSAVVALLVLAGVGIVVASVIMVTSGSYVIGPSTTVVTTGAMPGAPGTTMIVNNQGNNGAEAFVGAMMGATVGTVIGEAIDGDQGGGGGNIALALPQEKSKGGWIKHKNEYYHYEFTQTKCGKDVTLVRKFVK